eukprot:jgi/Orpsp1_1/1190717/evm.model.d7180000080729.1
MNKFIIILNIILLFICSFGNTKPHQKRGGQGIHVQGNTLLDGDGNPFIIRGINVAHTWFSSKTQSSINDIAALGANSVRIVLSCGAQWTKTPASEVSNIINWCENAGLICVLEIHDFTGTDNPTDITVTAVNYWKEIKDLLNAHKDYVIVNIANEWETGYKEKSIWADTYIEAIQSMRSMGIDNAIMLDATGWGQETGPVINDATRIVAADPNENVIFSYHVYSTLGKNEETMLEGFNGLNATGVCWIVGEFGWYQNGGDVAYKTLMDYCAKNNIGWMAWSWSGNGGDDAVLDLVSPSTFSKNDLTQWGKDVFYGDNGISQTSKLAYGGVIDTSNSNNTSNSETSSDNTYCSSCDVTATGSDGTLWGWENNQSCRIDNSKCNSGSDNTNDSNNNYDDSNSSSNISSDSNSSDNTYCSSCDVTATGSDGTLWGWENNQSCRINSSYCDNGNSNSNDSNLNYDDSDSSSNLSYDDHSNDDSNSGTSSDSFPSSSDSTSSDNTYCSSCDVTATGSDGTLWGWENNQSCRINSSYCDNGNSNSNDNNLNYDDSDSSSNLSYDDHSNDDSNSGTSSDNIYCASCDVTATGSDGTLWGWENNQSCIIDDNKCNGGSNSNINSDNIINSNYYDSGSSYFDNNYCSSCETTATGSDGSLWGWENNQSCRINTIKCNM